MSEREVQLELPFDAVIAATAAEAHAVISGAVVSLEFVRLQRHAEAMLRELISEGLVERLEA